MLLASTASALSYIDLFSGLVSPGQCSVKAFENACSGCSFTPQGKIDEACKEDKLDGGKACLFSTYPGLASKYDNRAKECPAIDICVNALQACIDSKCPGTDKQDCLSDYCRSCYPEGDRCIARASVDCMAAAKCPNQKCEDSKGENQETCCADCGCPEGKECKDNACYTPGTEPKPEIPSTTMPTETGGESERPPQGLGILWALLGEVVAEMIRMCGFDLAAPLLTASMSVLIGIPVLLKKR